MISLIGLLCTTSFAFSQSAPISIDGRFDDWVNQTSFIDTPESINGVDLLEFEVTNDEQFLFIKIIIDTELNLKEDDPIAHAIHLDIDTDNDPTTGFSAQEGYGAELSMDFSHRRVFFNTAGGSTELQFGAFRARFGPTVTSTEFEISIGRNAIPDGIHPLFTSSTIRILLRNADNGDAMPNAGEVFSYTFDETAVPALIPTNINKEDSKLVRIVAYNTLHDGLEEPDQVNHFRAIVKALNPDIIGFSECNNTSAATVLSLMNSWLPQENGQSWHILKNGDLITASRWPFLDNWPDLYRQFPVLVDLPDALYATDLLFTNAHLRCCGNNSGRQEQADEYAAFILDIKAGNIGIPENTPFVYGGDLNLVGYSQQLTTLITGDIQDEQEFGQGGFLDWDDTPLTDQICRQTDKRMAYTWRNDYSSFPPGRLDFVIFSDAVMSAEKSFALQTSVMPQDRLDLYGLDANNAEEASDHFPVTVDFAIHELVAVSAPAINIESVFPNPVEDKLTISFAEEGIYDIQLVDVLGRVVLTKSVNANIAFLDLEKQAAGTYLLIIDENTGKTHHSKIVVQRKE